MLLRRPRALADQVNDALRARILQKQYAPGSRLPSESELSTEFGVSRATIRSVLATLASDGLILRKQGDGTFVNERIDETNAHLGGLWEFYRLIENSRHKASIKPLSLVRRPATLVEAGQLGIVPGEEVLQLTRLFLADQQPAILAENVIPASLLGQPIELADGTLHLKQLLLKYCEREIAYAIIELHSVMAPEGMAELPQSMAGRPLLNVRIVFYDKESHPLVTGTSLHDNSVVPLRLVQAWG